MSVVKMTTDDSSKGSSGWIILIVVIAVIGVMGIILLIIWWMTKQDSENGANSTNGGNRGISIRCNGNCGVGTRVFNFVNDTDQTIWVGARWQKLDTGEVITGPLTGFKIKPNQCITKCVPDRVTGRIWPRTDCITDSDGKFVCKTGDCGRPDNNFGVECNDATGLPPVIIGEFTLSNPNDFYDLSNVDGYNIGMEINTSGGTDVPMDDTQFSCGSPTCKMNTATVCPDELIQADTGACFSICKAVNDKDQVAQHAILQQYVNNIPAADRGNLVDFLCCQCSDGSIRDIKCGESGCAFGCSPFDPSNPPNQVCTVGPNEYPEWPEASNGKNYAQVFKESCPDAYSWQFDDFNSTYQCKNPDYTIRFY